MTMKMKGTKKRIEMTYDSYEADAQPCAMADINYDWGMPTEQGYRITAQGLGAGVDEAGSVDGCRG